MGKEKLVKKLFLILVMFLAGCSFRLDSWEIDQATEICKDRKGISVISVFLDNSVTCVDGYKYSFKRTSAK